MNLEEYQPRSKLVTKETQVIQARFPVWDAHNHLELTNGGNPLPLAGLLDSLDSAGIETVIDLDGGWGEAIMQAAMDWLANEFHHELRAKLNTEGDDD